MIDPILCSECFNDQGLRFDSANIGADQVGQCPHCKSETGKKLDRELLLRLAYRFFVRGTVLRLDYGAAPVVQFNQYQTTNIEVPEWLKDDIRLIGDAVKVGFFYYGPRMWMVGEVYPLKSLINPSERNLIIQRILKEYPVRVLAKNEVFFRLRKDPQNPSYFSEYDTPPDSYVGTGRLDAGKTPIMYGSQDLEVCVHECRVTIDDNIFVATLGPTRDLKLLDLTEVLKEEGTEFESLDMAIHMLFLAGKHSYDITRDIAFSAQQAGLDGIIYPSYYSLVRTGAMPFDTAYGISLRKFPSQIEYLKSQVIGNLALFGRPIKDGIVVVKCINRLVLNRVLYDVLFGPVGY